VRRSPGIAPSEEPRASPRRGTARSPSIGASRLERHTRRGARDRAALREGRVAAPSVGACELTWSSLGGRLMGAACASRRRRKRSRPHASSGRSTLFRPSGAGCTSARGLRSRKCSRWSFDRRLPSGVMLPATRMRVPSLPTTTPAYAPAARCVTSPAVKVRRRLHAIPDGDAPHQVGHPLWFDLVPRAIVPRTWTQNSPS
jgi:hypothetical protein